MSYRLLPHVQLALVRVPGVGDDYRIDYHYQVHPVGAKGPVIPWLSDEQREQFLREGIVEEIDDGDPPSSPESDEAISVADNCAAALERLNVPTDAGAPACRTALREAGFRFGNAAISAAVKRRKDATTIVRDSSQELFSSSGGG